MKTFYGVSLGPGDPELITVKAKRILEESSVILVPVTAKGQVAMTILEGVLDLDNKEVVPMEFAMHPDAEKRKERHREHLETTLAYLEQESVAMVTLGDVSLYSTVSYLAEALKERGIQVEIIPGVTSFSAAAAALRIPLAKINEPIHILPASFDVDEDLEGTRIYMKGVNWTPKIDALLKEQGLQMAAAERVGLDGERLIPVVEKDEDLGYLSILIVRQP